MQTYSHFLLTLALYRLFSQRINDQSTLPTPVRPSAVLLGSILPDLPLIVIAITCMTADKIRHEDKHSGWTNQLFSTWYFHSPWVKAAHNFFHSPITLSLMLGMAYCGSKATGSRVATWCFWLLSACFLHTLCDIPVHHDDGPLILFPINWEYRYHSPLSYWDPNYHGREFAICEHIMDAVIILWELCRCCCRLGRTRYQAVDDYETELNETVQCRDDPRKPDVELATLVADA